MRIHKQRSSVGHIPRVPHSILYSHIKFSPHFICTIDRIIQAYFYNKLRSPCLRQILIIKVVFLIYYAIISRFTIMSVVFSLVGKVLPFMFSFWLLIFL
ncbi:hypothetical protein BDF14DRAFT_549228 [Spinellus fusiger]|nr:hypothetical protein BDF14DRAFT_549228 [Spinellus fusiger]